MRQTPSVARRAVLAVALLIGFYVLAIAIAAALLCIPWLEYRLIGRIEGRLGFFAVVGAGAILWALVPRPDRFDDPGPVLRAEDHPRLFEVLRAVARDTGQAMPAEVFLVPQLNAWVAQRGGVMGFGSRRVMGLGLPLLEALSVRQFRAVLAHEFGHYYGGDTRLGPWIYKTRAAIERTLRNVHAHSGLLAKPFQWYGNAFVRITHAVSRQQEFSADALAARTVGAAPLIEGLRFLHGSDGAFSAYWSQEVAPVLQLGARPPIAAGFRQFLAVPHVRTAVDQAVERELAEGEASPYDTHPCLRDRVAALAALPAGEPASDDPPAITLLEAPDRVEASLLAFMAGPGAPSLESVAWDDVGERVWLPFWRAQAARHAGRLAGLTPADLSEQAKTPAALAERLGLVPGNEVAGDDHVAQAGWVVGLALVTALRDRGWKLHAPPGEPVTLVHDGATVHPFSLLQQLVSGELGAADWLALVLGQGIAELDLGLAAGHDPNSAAPVGRPAWAFIAMAYYRLVLNRTYRVFVSDRSVSGARVRGLMSAPASVGPQHADPEFYVQPALARRYDGVDPDSDAFLAIDRANFRIPRETIVRMERITRRKWGLGGLPSSGRIVLHLQGGGRRELILLGHQDAEAIERGLTRTA
ncbi:MAG TPA: M48 family metallopeptidase [Gemmatimonadales bacterium]|nr:M48 family metallopeptidase [Gemmatimonadales bacterium]